MVTPAARRDAVAHAVERHGMSERRACATMAVDRSSVRYRSTGPDDAALRARLREFADQRRRFGYRRLHVLLRQEGHEVNRKKTQRLYREEGLTVQRRKSRRRIAVARTPIQAPDGPNSRWSLEGLSGVPCLGGMRVRPACAAPASSRPRACGRSRRDGCAQSRGRGSGGPRSADRSRRARRPRRSGVREG